MSGRTRERTVRTATLLAKSLGVVIGMASSLLAGITDGALLRGVELQAQPPGPHARILVAGDICAAHARAFPAGVASDVPWSGLRELVDDHDLRLANLECPLTLSDEAISKSGPGLRADPAWAATLRNGGFDLLSLANNHIRDYGTAGVMETIAACESAGLQIVGAGEDLARARLPVVRSVAGLRVGVLAIAENEFGSARHGRAGGNPFDPLTTPRDVRQLASEADAVLVLFHGGVEGYRLPSPGLKRICRALVEAGASAVVCSHAHVPSGLETYEGAPIVYGTGNFFLEAPPGFRVGRDFYVGYCVSMWVGRGGVWRIALAPYRQRAGLVLVEPLGEAAARELMRQTVELSATIADDARLAAKWREFCVARRATTLASALGLTRVERRLLRHGVWPSWRLPRRRLPALLNLIRCESHQERLVTSLEMEHEQVEREPRAVNRDRGDATRGRRWPVRRSTSRRRAPS